MMTGVTAGTARAACMQRAGTAQMAHPPTGAGVFRDSVLGLGARSTVRADGRRQGGHLESKERQKQKGDLGG
jgi:hypothetical protein